MAEKNRCEDLEGFQRFVHSVFNVNLSMNVVFAK